MPKKPATTPARPAPVDFSEVRNILAEAAKLSAENAKGIAEMRKANAKADAEARARQAGIDKQLAELGERADKALKVAEKNNRYISNHANGESEILEIECKGALLKMGKLGGVKLEDVTIGLNSSKEGGVGIDLVGINGKVTFPMEVKRTLYPEDVVHFRDVQVKRFKKAFPYLVRDKDVVPVVIFALRKKRKNAKGKKEDPVQLALDAGMVVLQSTGENQLAPVTDISQVVTRSPKSV